MNIFFKLVEGTDGEIEALLLCNGFDELGGHGGGNHVDGFGVDFGVGLPEAVPEPVSQESTRLVSREHSPASAEKNQVEIAYL